MIPHLRMFVKFFAIFGCVNILSKVVDVTPTGFAVKSINVLQKGHPYGVEEQTGQNQG